MWRSIRGWRSIFRLAGQNFEIKFINEKKKHISIISKRHEYWVITGKYSQRGGAQTEVLWYIALENDFRKQRVTESFFISSAPNVIVEKCSDLFPQICKVTFGHDW